MAVTHRIAVRIAEQFGADADTVIWMLKEAEAGKFRRVAAERVTAAIVIRANGDADRLFRAIEEMQIDWRDLFMSAQLGHADWRADLDDAFGPRDWLDRLLFLPSDYVAGYDSLGKLVEEVDPPQLDPAEFARAVTQRLRNSPEMLGEWQRLCQDNPVDGYADFVIREAEDVLEFIGCLLRQ
ncbi:hypothetical protein HLK59_41480 [Streptomyces sp. S3(2020)]|uniref:hypothetical protein n=1 Tax=Streptomyces sp. S3(2020) TaxID=2732044 RepID=UPI00148787EF|nr:hypothetical protein [Streptomyces sp. S3(2020)]NNN36717.1 hypothetical protein [Streptomyces sp. S3(2020)]